MLESVFDRFVSQEPVDRVRLASGDLCESPGSPSCGSRQNDLFSERFEDGGNRADQCGFTGARTTGEDGDPEGKNIGDNSRLL